MLKRISLLIACLFFFGGIDVGVGRGSGTVAAQQLAEDQHELASKFERLEILALRIADQAEEEEPERANQIRQTLRRAQTLGVEERFEQVVELLETNKLSAAGADQKELASQLEELYRLILADPRESALEQQRKAWEKVEKEVRRLIRAQRSLRSRVEREPTDSLSKEQQELAEQTEQLGKTDPLDKASPSSQAEEGEGQESENSEGESHKGEGSEGEGQEGEAKQTPTANQTPAQRVQKRLQRAEQAMREAEKRLEKDEKSAAAKKQLRAQHELESAQREAEEMLRQLREEEKQRKLASLADRLRSMKTDETALLKATESAEKIASRRSARELTIEATKLSQRQTTIAGAARRAMQLIEEDGKSLAFAEAIRAAAADMQTIEKRLRQSKVGKLTQQIEQGVVEALDEMLQAVEAKLEQMQQEQQEQGSGEGQSGGGDPGLLAKIAELRLLRSSQVRLKRQTVQWEAALEAGEATRAEATSEFKRLADAQSRLAAATHHAANQ